MRIRSSVFAPAIVLGVVVLSGCTEVPGTDSRERAFQNRERVPSCGNYAVIFPKGPPDVAIACLLDAEKQRRGAELAITHTTPEGEPIVTYYRSRRGEPGFEIFKDNTADRYRSVDWEHRMCDDLTWKGAEVVETGCEEVS